MDGRLETQTSVSVAVQVQRPPAAEFPLAQQSSLSSGLYRLPTDWTSPAHSMEGTNFNANLTSKHPQINIQNNV